MQDKNEGNKYLVTIELYEGKIEVVYNARDENQALIACVQQIGQVPLADLLRFTVRPHDEESRRKKTTQGV